MEKKPWYKSKIVLLAITALTVIGGNLLTGFITGAGVTPEQINVIAQTQPTVADQIENVQHGGNVFQAISAIGFALVGVWRAWWTKTVIG